MGGGTPGELNKQELRALQSAMQTQAHKGYRVAAGLMLGVIALTGIGASISRRGAGARSEGSAAEMPDAGVAAPITAPPEKAFRVCGQYCGDNWCSGQKIKESDCALLPELAEPEHCYDRCCQNHDFCCTAGHEQRDCNHSMVDCVQACAATDFGNAEMANWLQCGFALEAAMSVIQRCECGLCPTPQSAWDEMMDPGHADKLRRQYNGSRTRPGWYQFG